MTCPVCGGETTVLYTRNVDCESIKRRRKCRDCLYKFTTMEYEVETKATDIEDDDYDE